MKIGEQELFLIKDLAINAGCKLSIRSLYQNSDMLTAYAYTTGLLMYLNSKGLLKEEINVDERLDPKYRKD